MLFKKKKVTKEKRLEKYWDDFSAKQCYRVVEYTWVNGKLQDGYTIVSGGDSDWANRQAKHYGLRITTPIKED